VRKRKLPGVSTVEEMSVQMDGEGVEAELRARFLNPSYRPPVLPRVAIELLELSRRKDVGIDDVVHLLHKDAMLVGRVLRIASSPMYLPTPRATEPSLREAVVRLGVGNLRDVVVEVVMQMRVFQAKQYAREMTRVARHTSATAHLARLLGRRSGAGGDLAFLAGLFHDVGVAGALVALGDVPEGQPVPRLADVWTAIDSVHPELSGVMVEQWGLPAELRRAATDHRGLAELDTVEPLAAVACIAEHLANRLGWSVHSMTGTEPEKIGLDRVQPADLDRATAELSLSDAHLASLENAGGIVLKQLAGSL
jgi:HD-like signal output (HDOD) protein